MDVISHALWGRHLTHLRMNWKFAAVIGMLPDLVAFIPGSISNLIQGNDSVRVDENTRTEDFPAIAWDIYSFSHSLFWSTILLLFIWGILLYWGNNVGLDKEGRLPINKILLYPMRPFQAACVMMTPWFFHILLDIPTHTARFFPTPIFYPLSKWVFDGTRWSVGWIWFTNVFAIIIVGIILYKMDNKQPKNVTMNGIRPHK